MSRDVADADAVFEALKQDVIERITKSREPLGDEGMYEPWGGIFSKSKEPLRPQPFVLKTPGSA
jgi:hypothetical protein